MLPLVITNSIIVGSFANGYGGVGGSASHIIIMEGQELYEGLSRLFCPLFPFLESSSSYEESSSSLEEEPHLVLLALTIPLSLLFSVVTFSSLFMRSSNFASVEALALELSSLLLVLDLSSNLSVASSSSPFLDFASPSG
jgi:hypothetical protein